MSEPEWCESGIGYEDEDENEWHGSRARVEVVEKDERGLVDEGGLVVPDLGSQKASIAFEKGAHVQPECGRRSSEVPEMDSQRLDSQTSAEKSACQQRAQEFDDTSGVT
ncbi:hypothetical protein AX16_010451 [Volvariella volvacea WC 439]|nr:hypothetical protein AX16_010451 [Volvariella volvacea WC 439]